MNHTDDSSKTGSIIHAPGTGNSASVFPTHTDERMPSNKPKMPNVCQQSLISTVDVIDHSVGS